LETEKGEESRPHPSAEKAPEKKGRGNSDPVYLVRKKKRSGPAEKKKGGERRNLGAELPFAGEGGGREER